MAAKRRRLSKSQIAILIVILLSAIAVAAAIIAAVFLRPENLVKSKISGLASDYYENYLYESFDFDNISNENLTKFKESYEKYGLTPTKLRQIFIHNRHQNNDDIQYIKKYCDEDGTVIRFYPESPYSRTSYRVEYTYSCEF